MSFRCLILTGDYSGDHHAAGVVDAITHQLPDAQFAGVGGPNLARTGATIIHDQANMGKLGLSSLLSIPQHWQLGRKVLTFSKEWQPDVVLLIDYGMFNLHMAKQFKTSRQLKKTPTVLYFIPPQVWVSRRHRLKTIRAFVDHVFCIFPFEKPLYAAENIPVTYVGHPLVRQLPPPVTKNTFCNRHNLNPNVPLLGVFPGSRRSEIAMLLTPMIGCLKQIRQNQPNVEIVLAQAESIPDVLMNQALEKAYATHKTSERELKLQIIQSENHALLSASTAALLASGTVTLEAALYKTPMVIAYRLQPWVYAIAMQMVYLKRAGLPNILTDIDNPPIPEVLQDDLTPANLFAALSPLLDEMGAEDHALKKPTSNETLKPANASVEKVDHQTGTNKFRQRQLDAFDTIAAELHCETSAAVYVANEIIQLLQIKKKEKCFEKI
ncbi:MAG: lipid-A-disaccharide synthase [Cyanobacteria bacterium P01_H01_bin.74]